MINRVLDLSDRPARLSVRNSLLVLQFAPSASAPAVQPPAALPNDAEEKTYRCERLGDPDEMTIPLGDVAVLIVSHPQVSYSNAVLSGLAVSGAILVTCNEKHMPVSMLLPLVAHSLQSERFSAQAALPLPAKKRIWQQIVRAKVLAQARLLEERTGADSGLRILATRVSSGDAGNLEAQAARIYWQQLFPNSDFRRDPEGEGLNAVLNYGYAVLRAIVARSLCGAGLHPSLGVHHHNRYDAFCLADDLMEPFRPIVDREAANLNAVRGASLSLDKESKRALLQILLGRFEAGSESRTLFDWASRAASSLAEAIEHRAGNSRPFRLDLGNPHPQSPEL